MDLLDDYLMSRPPSPAYPLLGLTILLVEDSRYASDAIRLLCQRSGARLRRADTLAHARRHLAVYRPSVVIVDLGLPDGPGLALIREVLHEPPPAPVVLAISGEPEGAHAALAAGAAGFIAKPVASLAGFQQAILRHLPPDRRPRMIRSAEDPAITPDPLALVDDLDQAAAMLARAKGAEMDYALQFIGSLARDGGDRQLAAAVVGFVQARDRGEGHGPARAALDRALLSALQARAPAAEVAGLQDPTARRRNTQAAP